jgi:hypothetical protein
MSDVQPKPRLSWLQEFASAARALWDPKTVLFTLITIAFGAVAGWGLLGKPLAGAGFVFTVLGFTYIARTMAFPQVSFGEFSAKAKETPLGAAIVLAAVILWCAAMSLLFTSSAYASPLGVSSAIPAAAHRYLPVITAEAKAHWSPQTGRSAPLATIAGLVDHETACPRVATCFRPEATYKTAREEGVGFGMMTRAFTANGKLRFDALGELKALHPTALREANWGRNKFNPELQARALVLKVSDNYATAARLTPFPEERLTFAVVMHNRGTQGVANEIAACAMTRGCDRTRWTNNVERTCTASRQIIPGTGRSACDISRAYAPDVARRSIKYQGVV